MLVRISLVVDVEGEPDELEMLREALVDAARNHDDADDFELELADAD